MHPCTIRPVAQPSISTDDSNDSHDSNARSASQKRLTSSPAPSHSQEVQKSQPQAIPYSDSEYEEALASEENIHIDSSGQPNTAEPYTGELREKESLDSFQNPLHHCSHTLELIY